MGEERDWGVGRGVSRIHGTRFDAVSLRSTAPSDNSRQGTLRRKTDTEKELP